VAPFAVLTQISERVGRRRVERRRRVGKRWKRVKRDM
jgi:hypothetical protein